MTKLRDPGSIEAAALEALHLLGVEETARLVDRGPSSVRHWTDPDEPGRPTVHQALAIDGECVRRHGRAPFFIAYTGALRRQGESAQVAVGDVLLETLELTDSVGRFAGLVRAAKAIGSPDGPGLTPRERAELLTQVKRMRKELDDAERAIRKAQRPL